MHKHINLHGYTRGKSLFLVVMVIVIISSSTSFINPILIFKSSEFSAVLFFFHAHFVLVFLVLNLHRKTRIKWLILVFMVRIIMICFITRFLYPILNSINFNT